MRQKIQIYGIAAIFLILLYNSASGLVIYWIMNQFFSNNISSLYAAMEHLGNCFILDGDQIINNAAVLTPPFTRSSYLATWCEEETKEWLLQVQDGVVTSCSRTGGRNGYQLYSVSRWTKDDGAKLAQHVKTEFEAGNTDIYWDDVALFCYPQEYQLGIWQMQPGDVIEIDSLEELNNVSG